MICHQLRPAVWELFSFLLVLLTIGRAHAQRGGEEQVAAVADAFVKVNHDRSCWTIGTNAVQMTFALDSGKLRLASCLNKLTSPPNEYVDAASSVALLPTVNAVFPDSYLIEQIWSKPLTAAASADPAGDRLQLPVRAGDMIGFTSSKCGQASVAWSTKVNYGDGESYLSADDTSLAQGPIWYYYLHAAGTGFMAPLSSLEGDGENKCRVPAGGYYYPMWSRAVSASGTGLHSTDYQAVRVWKAPKDGRVSISGTANILGGGSVDVAILRIKESADGSPITDPPAGAAWRSDGATARQVIVGGRSAVQLDWPLDSVTNEGLRATLCAQAYPNTSIVRHWVEVKNNGSQAATPDFFPQVFAVSLATNDTEPLVHHWMVGGNNGEDQGMLKSAPVTPSYHQAVGSHAQFSYTPWMAVQRTTGDRDGCFAEVDCTSMWRMSVDRDHGGPLTIGVGLPDLQFTQPIQPGEEVKLPLITLGVFRDDLDDMGRRLYDWQYAYLWDYTRHDWYGRTLYAAPIYSMNTGTASNQENFARRLWQDTYYADLGRRLGFELLWDDAGWYAQPGFWNTNREGPDFAETVRYLNKSGMKWTLWFLSHPTPELMDTKVGSWGDFQWRTDGVAMYSLQEDQDFRKRVERFLNNHPRSSFHTCAGGGTFAHTFEMQRYADANYFADFGGDQANYYFSYTDTPDKWFDNLVCTMPKVEDNRARRLLAMVPMWGAGGPNGDDCDLAPVTDLYRYLLDSGVAGKWSYVAHPVIQGDVEHQYFQRLSHDAKRSIIILKHKPAGEVTIYPRGLLPEHLYLIEFEKLREKRTETGSDLMARGIVLKSPEPGELVFLNLPDRPGSGRDQTPPLAPGRALMRRESNMGYAGVGLYWSAGRDENWVSAYEVRRSDQVLERIGTGTFCFDRSNGWDPQAEYAVRTIDGDGNASPWTLATRMVDEPLAFSALGGHAAQSALNGWRAETTTNGSDFSEMTWVPPGNLAPVWLDIAKQAGGAGGYWEGAETARVGHGWQQASAAAACVRTWTAPQAGTVRVVGRAIKDLYHQNKGGQLRVRILHNDAQVWPTSDWAEVPQSGMNGIMHDLTLNITSGETIRFVLDKGSTPANDYLAWMPTIVHEAARDEGAPASVVRIRCGSTTDYSDACGNVWSRDRFFAGGKPHATQAHIAGAAPTPEDETLYQAGRTGEDFCYAIPVSPGLYSLRLKFAETEYDTFFQRPLNVTINGRTVLRNFDICQAAGGRNRAREETFHYLVPDADGNLTVRLCGGWDRVQTTSKAIVQAIEILPELKSRLRINVGSDTEFVDWSGSIWSSDVDLASGQPMRSDAAVSQTSPTLYDQELYRTARTGRRLTYDIPVSPGLYTVQLKLAELWLTEAGKRPMNITIGGRLVRESWDLAQAAGQLAMAADFRVDDVAPDKDGRIRIVLDAVGENEAILQGIEIE